MNFQDGVFSSTETSTGMAEQSQPVNLIAYRDQNDVRNSQSPSAATSMIVQMTSGMVITLLIHPAREFRQVVHRCVVRYDRDAIVKARQAAGLTVNLDQRDENAVAKSPTSLQIAPVPKTTPENVAPSTPVSQSTQNAELPVSAPQPQRKMRTAPWKRTPKRRLQLRN
jgi:hypothetical protein